MSTSNAASGAAEQRRRLRRLQEKQSVPSSTHQQEHTVEMTKSGVLADREADESHGKRRTGANASHLLPARDSDDAVSLTCAGGHSWSNLSGEERGNVLLLIVLYFLQVRERVSPRGPVSRLFRTFAALRVIFH